MLKAVHQPYNVLKAMYKPYNVLQSVCKLYDVLKAMYMALSTSYSLHTDWSTL